MSEILFFAWDHSTQSVPRPSLSQLAALPKNFDMITARPDGWSWGSDELSLPIFRIIAWPTLSLIDTEVYLAHQPPLVDADLRVITLHQYRGFFMDLMHEVLPKGFKEWWTDDSRRVPMYTVTLSPDVATELRKVRSRVPISEV